MTIFQLAIKHDDHYQLAYFNKGNMYFSNARWEEALKTYTQAIQLDKRDVHSLLNRGITKVMLRGDFPFLSLYVVTINFGRLILIIITLHFLV